MKQKDFMLRVAHEIKTNLAIGQDKKIYLNSVLTNDDYIEVACKLVILMNELGFRPPGRELVDEKTLLKRPSYGWEDL